MNMKMEHETIAFHHRFGGRLQCISHSERCSVKRLMKFDIHSSALDVVRVQRSRFKLHLTPNEVRCLAVCISELETDTNLKTRHKCDKKAMESDLKSHKTSIRKDELLRALCVSMVFYFGSRAHYTFASTKTHFLLAFP